APVHGKLQPVVVGGATRQASVYNGLNAMAAAAPQQVLIHDAARPFARPALIDRVTAALSGADAVVPTLPVANTLKRVEAGSVVETVARDHLEAAETPQGFTFKAIRDAHERAAAARLDFTDDAAIAEWAGTPVRVVPGDPG